jgi:hypothetical protein
MRGIIGLILVNSLILSGCAATGSVGSAPTPAPVVALVSTTTVVSPSTPLTQHHRDATAQATPFDGGVTIETEQCCTSRANGKTDRLFVRFDAISRFGQIQAMRILVEPGQDCGGRSPDTSAPLPNSVKASWEPYTNLRRDYAIPVPQERLRIVVQFRDLQGHVFLTPAGCDDAVGLGIVSLTPTP